MTPTAQEPHRTQPPPARSEVVSSRFPIRYYLATVLLLAIAVRVVGLNEQSLSMDEVAELSIAEASLPSILVAHDGFPPLYHFVLHAWSAVLPGDLAARCLSLVIGVLSVGVVWATARRVAGERIALWCTLIVALSPFHSWHSQEARAYILYYLCAAIALYWFFAALKTNTAWAWGCYAATAWLGLLSHYHFGLLVLTNVCVVVLEWGRLAPRRRVLIAHAALAVASIPILWLLRGDLSLEGAVSFPNRVNPAAVGYTLFSFVAGYAIGPSVRELHGMSVGQAISQVLPWLVVTGASAGVLLVYGYRVLSPGLWSRRLVLMTLLPVVGAAAAAAALGVTFQVRHVLWASIPLMLLLGAGAAEVSRRPAIIGPALLALLLVFGVSRYHRHSLLRYKNEDVRGLAVFLRAQDPVPPIFVTTGYMAKPIRHYLGDSPAIHSIPSVQPDGTNLPQALRAVEREAPSTRPFWLAYTREFHGDPQGRLLEALRQRYTVTLRASFPGIRLYRLGPATTAPP
jgi:Dolichyl-phosphate-mannose-protein mannosyltransferase